MPSGTRELELAAAPETGGLPEPVMEKMESAFGADFSAVEFRTDSARAVELGARAFTDGRAVHFAPGEWDPRSVAGQEIIGHELAHVVQHSQGRVRETVRMKSVSMSNDDALEREADAAGARAARGEVVMEGVGRVGSSAGPVQRLIVENGAALSVADVRARGKELGWSQEIIEDAAALAKAADPVVGWQDVVGEVQLRQSSAAGMTVTEADFGDDASDGADADWLPGAGVADHDMEDADSKDAGSAIAVDEVAMLTTDASKPIVPPADLDELIRKTGRMDSLFKAGNATNAAFAIGRDGDYKAFGRESKAKDTTWSSGAAHNNDDLVADAEANHDDVPDHEKGVYHAEEKVVKSNLWKTEALAMLKWAQREQAPVEIWLMINRASCEMCVGSLIAARTELLATMKQMGIPPERVLFGVSVLGYYTKGTDADITALQQGGWVITTPRGYAGDYTDMGSKLVAKNLRL